MGEKNDSRLSLYAVRMNWLAWIGRPFIAVWRLLVRLGRFIWDVAVLTFRAFRVSWDHRFWVLAAVGAALAVFFMVSSILLSSRLAIPMLGFLGVPFALLAVSWSMAEIANLLRRSAVIENEYTLSEIRYQLGAGFRAVGILLKYALLTILFFAMQFALSLVVTIPGLGGFLYALVMVPMAAFALFALCSAVLLVFGIWAIPTHVVYGIPGRPKGFLARQWAEFKYLVSCFWKSWPRLLAGTVPGAFLGVVALLVPAILLVAAMAGPLFFIKEAGFLPAEWRAIPQLVVGQTEALLSGHWDNWGAMTAFFGSLSVGVLAAFLLAPLVSFLACLAFRTYTAVLGLYSEGGDGPILPQEKPAFGVPMPGEAEFGGQADENLTLADLDSGFGDEVSGDEILASIESTMPLSPYAEELPGQQPDDEALTLDDLDSGFGDDVSGDEILASIESTMPLSAFAEELPGQQPDDETFTLDDLESGVDDVSGEDILASIESTMPLSAEPQELPGVVPDEESLSLADLDGGLQIAGAAGEDEVSGEDILASIESTMPLSGEPVEFPGVDFADQDALPLQDGHDVAPVVGQDELDSLNKDMDALLGADTLDQPLSPDDLEADNEKLSSLNLDDVLGNAESGPAVVPDSGFDLGESLDDLLGGKGEFGEIAPAMIDSGIAGSGQAVSGTTADFPDDIGLDALLGGENGAAGAQAAGNGGVAGPDAGLEEWQGNDTVGTDLDALFGGTEAGADSIAPGDIALDDLPAAAPGSASSAANDPGFSDEPNAFDGGIDDFLGGPAGGAELDALLGGTGDAAVDTGFDTGTSTGDAGLDDLLGGDAGGAELDALLGGTGDAAVDTGFDTGAPTADAGLDDLLGGDAGGTELDALLGGTGDAAVDTGFDTGAPTGDAGLDDLLGGGADLDALLGGAGAGNDMFSGDATDSLPDDLPDAGAIAGEPGPPSAPAASSVVELPMAEPLPLDQGTYFKGKGKAGPFTYLVTVKEENHLLFGIKGANSPGPLRFQLLLEFESGRRSNEMLTIERINEKGLGSTVADFSEMMRRNGYGKIVSVGVAAA